MKCDDVKELMDELINNELDWSLVQKMEAHIKQCSACEETLSGMRAIGDLLRDSLPIFSPSVETEAAVMGAFSRARYEEKTKTIRPTSRKTLFAPITLPMPAFGLSAVAILALLGIAFQTGRLSAGDVTPAIPMVDSHVPRSAPEQPPRTQVEVPSTKVVTRFVYLKRPRQKKSGTGVREAGADMPTLNTSIAENGYMTQTSLKRFQPVSTIKFRVVKGSRSYEK